MDLMALITCNKHTTTTTLPPPLLLLLLISIIYYLCGGRTIIRPIKAQEHKKYTNKKQQTHRKEILRNHIYHHN